VGPAPLKYLSKAKALILPVFPSSSVHSFSVLTLIIHLVTMLAIKLIPLLAALSTLTPLSSARPALRRQAQGSACRSKGLVTNFAASVSGWKHGWGQGGNGSHTASSVTKTSGGGYGSTAVISTGVMTSTQAENAAIGLSNVSTVVLTSSTSATVTSATITRSSAQPSSTGTDGDDSLTAEQQAWITAHNAARAEYGAAEVTWCKDCATVAEENYNNNKGTCGLIHTA
jgi:hypothetical protein